MSGQKVKILIKECFKSSLLHKYLENEQGELDLDSNDGYNKDLLGIVIGRHGKQVIAHVTEDGMLAVSRETFGNEGFVMIGEEFIEMDSIEVIGSPYIKGKMYRLTDQGDKLGMFVKQRFDQKTKEVIYTIVTSDREAIEGTTLVEMGDDDLDLFGFGIRSDYYAKA